MTALAIALGGCGGDDSSDSDGATGTYRVGVVTAEFPAKQRLGETTLMRLGVRNDGERTIPALNVSITLAGRDGEASGLPFGIRDPQPGLAQPDRPVWVLAEHYPKLAGSDEPGGAEISSRKIFYFGPLEPGETTEAVWKLTASRTGRYRLLYGVGAGIGGRAKVEAAAGSRTGGSFPVEIAETTPELTVDDDGEVVEVDDGSERPAQ